MRSLFLKDMAYRRLRVILTIVGVALLSTLILLFGGIMNGLRWQARRYVDFSGADVWVSRERSGGVFVGFSLLNPEYIVPPAQAIAGRLLAKDVGVAPLIFAHARPVVRRSGVESEVKAVVVGYKAGKLGGPNPSDLVRGRMFVPSPTEYSTEQSPDMEAIVDESIGLEVGESLDIGGYDLKVVGIVRDMMFVFDTPFIFMDVRTAQKAVLEDVIYVNTFLAKAGTGQTAKELADLLRDAERGLTSRFAVEVQTSEESIEKILQNYVDEPMRGVQMLRVMLWVATALIVGMITYVTTMEKTQELGVMKAIGADNLYVLRLVLSQVLVMSVAGVGLGVGLAMAAVPAFPIFVLLDPREVSVIALLSIGVCLVGGLVAAGRALRVDPMVAFRGEL